MPKSLLKGSFFYNNMPFHKITIWATIILISVFYSYTKAWQQNSSDYRILIEFHEKPSIPSKTDDLLQWENTPVPREYLNELSKINFKTIITLKWQNKVLGTLPKKQLTALKEFPFIKRSKIIQSVDSPGTQKRAGSIDTYGHAGQFISQTNVDNIHREIKSLNMKAGKSIIIAIIDENFSLSHKVLSHLDSNNLILDAWDFPESTSFVPDFITSEESHGGEVLSVIASYQPGEYVGISPFSSFLLYKAEIGAIESEEEEIYVAAAIERAVDNNAQIISISLGYRWDFSNGTEHPYEEMDGRTRPASIAAQSAARRNVLVIAAMGNENNKDYGNPTLGSPADADSILSVGAINTSDGVCTFSSYGPTFDGRLKPEISAPGCPVEVPDAQQPNNYKPQYGTSVATPIVAGICALLWQLFPDVTAQEIRNAVIKSGRDYPASSYSKGYGRIDAAAAAAELRQIPFFIPRKIVFNNTNSINFGVIERNSLSHINIYDIRGGHTGKAYITVGENIFWRPKRNIAYQILFTEAQ